VQRRHSSEENGNDEIGTAESRRSGRQELAGDDALVIAGLVLLLPAQD